MTSTAAPIVTPRLGHRLLRQLPLLALGLAILAVALLALGPLGWRAGWWHFRVAFTTLMPWSAYCGLAAVAAAILALVLAGRVSAGRHIAVGVLAFIIAAGIIGAGIAYVPWHYDRMRGTFPSIHDITTDWDNPPQFHAILPLRETAGAYSAAYEGTRISDLQRRDYPDIAPLTLELGSPAAFARALETAEQLGWTIVAADTETGRIEASERSRWFGFTDDVVIRVAAAGHGSRIDIRSVSRVTRGGDFGVNAARVRAFLGRLRGAS